MKLNELKPGEIVSSLHGRAVKCSAAKEGYGELTQDIVFWCGDEAINCTLLLIDGQIVRNNELTITQGQVVTNNGINELIVSGFSVKNETEPKENEMQIISGTIVSIVPDGGYDGSNGHIYTFQMTIQTDAGPVTAQIGSKSQTYPVALGADISVEYTTSAHGPRFKKYNPKYVAQPLQQPAQPAQQQPAQQQSYAATQQPTFKQDVAQSERPYYPDDNGVLIVREVSIKAAVVYCHGEPYDPVSMAQRFEKYIITGKADVEAITDNGVPV